MIAMNATRKKFRTVVIGAGSRANAVIYPSLADICDLEIAAVCDIDKKSLKETGDKYNILKRYGDNVYSYRDMIDDIHPDAVFAIGNPHEFYDIWIWCLNKGMNLFVEKPLGISVHQAQSLKYAAEKNKCITRVSLQRRMAPMVVKLHDECAGHGQIMHAVCKFYKCNMVPFLGARDHMMDDCFHSIDTLRWMCGGEIISIESQADRIGVPDINFISATLYFDNGSTGYLINSWSSGRRIFAVEMHADGIYAEAEHEGKGYLYRNGNGTPEVYDARQVAGSNELHVYTGVFASIEEFVNCCRSGIQPSSNFSDACKTMHAAEIILAQAIRAKV
jgi:virulence factor